MDKHPGAPHAQVCCNYKRLVATGVLLHAGRLTINLSDAVVLQVKSDKVYQGSHSLHPHQMIVSNREL